MNKNKNVIVYVRNNGKYEKVKVSYDKKDNVYKSHTVKSTEFEKRYGYSENLESLLFA